MAGNNSENKFNNAGQINLQQGEQRILSILLFNKGSMSFAAKEDLYIGITQITNTK